MAYTKVVAHIGMSLSNDFASSTWAMLHSVEPSSASKALLRKLPKLEVKINYLHNITRRSIIEYLRC